MEILEDNKIFVLKIVCVRNYITVENFFFSNSHIIFKQSTFKLIMGGIIVLGISQIV